ncbi:MAG TPA: hypothetical protein VHP33_11510 [Polyangiaceae bacterium]|nr:hypothetical protein [Polyangiaceae bacterium]
MEEENEAEEQGGGAGFNPEVLRSYLLFARAALKARRGVMAVLAVTVLVLTGLTVKYFPKTYSCTTSLMAVENAVLDQNGGSRPLVAAQGLLLRHENLEQLIKDTNLVETYPKRRPPLLALKDKISAALRGKMDRKTTTAVLVGTLETRLRVEVKDSVLEITADWNDPVTCAELATALRDEFLKLRHTAEISAFQEKIEILDVHATELRTEIGALAEQMKAALAARAEEVVRDADSKKGDDDKATAPRRVAAAKPAGPDEATVELKKRLAEAKQQLSVAEGIRAQRIATEQAKVDELKLRFTPSHPQVITQEERVAMASDVPSELALLRSDVADLDAQLRQREGRAPAAKTSPTAVSPEARHAASTALLPADILRLLEREDVDPALGAQMSSAVMRYSSLMDGVRGSKLALDTAQAAFKHRYQVVIPAEEPRYPTKPKPAIILGVGAFLALLLALIVPILLELRRGVIVERWQVDLLQLPVLGELKLPPKSN